MLLVKVSDPKLKLTLGNGKGAEAMYPESLDDPEG